ncbi:histidine--tRNA ligase [Anaeramoeba flamelloides]|uniref:Histidine--tRNA ligase n=1 Tax=Anaeramoeba flamelloides TaxID=1746091 RepID=A0ABQ8Y198_9EUKA|nr:histidine--tRNA ligase [Anaeramoeba flamelloides]
MSLELKTLNDLHNVVKKNFIEGHCSFQGKLTSNKVQTPVTFELFHDKLELAVGNENLMSLSYQDNPDLQFFIHQTQKDLLRIDVSEDSSLQFLCRNSSERYIFTKTFQMFKYFGGLRSFDETFTLNQTILGKNDELNAIAGRSVNQGGVKLKGLFAIFQTGSQNSDEQQCRTTIIFGSNGIDFQTEEFPSVVLKWSDNPQINRDDNTSKKLLISLKETKIILTCPSNDYADLIFECFTSFLKYDQENKDKNFNENEKEKEKEKEKENEIELELEKETEKIPKNTFFCSILSGHTANMNVQVVLEKEQFIFYYRNSSITRISTESDIKTKRGIILIEEFGYNHDNYISKKQLEQNSLVLTLKKKIKIKDNQEELQPKIAYLLFSQRSDLERFHLLFTEHREQTLDNFKKISKKLLPENPFLELKETEKWMKENNSKIMFQFETIGKMNKFHAQFKLFFSLSHITLFSLTGISIHQITKKTQLKQLGTNKKDSNKNNFYQLKFEDGGKFQFNIPDVSEYKLFSKLLNKLKKNAHGFEPISEIDNYFPVSIVPSKKSSSSSSSLNKANTHAASQLATIMLNENGIKIIKITETKKVNDFKKMKINYKTNLKKPILIRTSLWKMYLKFTSENSKKLFVDLYTSIKQQKYPKKSSESNFKDSPSEDNEDELEKENVEMDELNENNSSSSNDLSGNRNEKKKEHESTSQSESQPESESGKGQSNSESDSDKKSNSDSDNKSKTDEDSINSDEDNESEKNEQSKSVSDSDNDNDSDDSDNKSGNDSGNDSSNDKDSDDSDNKSGNDSDNDNDSGNDSGNDKDSDDSDNKSGNDSDDSNSESDNDKNESSNKSGSKSESESDQKKDSSIGSEENSSSGNGDGSEDSD